MRAIFKMDQMETAATLAAASGGAGGSKVAVGMGIAKIGVILGGAVAIILTIVQLMTTPTGPKEQIVAGLSTFTFSIFGGCIAIMHFGLLAWVAPGPDQLIGVVAIGGVFIACGAPGWLVVNAFFNWVDKVKGQTLPEIVKEAKEDIL